MKIRKDEFKMTLEELYKRLSYRDAIISISLRDFPWDRGYKEGFSDGLDYAFKLIKRLKLEEKE